MTKSTLLGRRIHIAGSIDKDGAIATTEEVVLARSFVQGLTAELVKAGATFVVPVDDEKLREVDDQPICFDWLVQKTIFDNLVHRPVEASQPGGARLITVVQHHKSEAQIPCQYADLWDALRGSDHVYVENANQWDMNSKRLEMQAVNGDILITLGGSEGVLFLANLYHDAGKPVIPLDFALTPADKGSRRLFRLALTRQYSERFFRTENGAPAHGLMNRINFAPRHDTSQRIHTVMELLRALERPTVFAIRLLNPKHEKYSAVEDYFEGVVKPVVESLGFKMVIVDGRQPSEESIINLEIFTKLHRSNVVVADITGERANNFIELGYALGRGHRVMVTAEEGTKNPFDIEPVPTHFWKSGSSVSLREKQTALHEYWRANAARRRIVEPDPLVP
jgi:hypothetical protein